ncbi:hypothetical protein PoB_005690500 [Plakobranchus ocellatus]|uniref:Uncharacterized protein n=1 Tax=Plakobranchus ocellatus TaxID=259542 RepID=A0AAV4CCD7_9GAST|nr:hypothetical protein PoB_005690500 [Plakobranchus ocellatus]
MDTRIRKNPSYKVFVEETRNLLTYVLQEIRLRKTYQAQLTDREAEMQKYIDLHNKDPRVSKALKLADHWRKEKDHSEEKIQTLLMEINTLNLDMKILETKMNSLQRRLDKMEMQIQKSRTCEQEKERLEEQILLREKAVNEIGDTVENLNNTINLMKTEATQKEQDFKAKLEAAPTRFHAKLAALSRELEMMSLEKEYKMQEARELHDHVNVLIMENYRSAERVKILMGSVRRLRVKNCLNTSDAGPCKDH